MTWDWSRTISREAIKAGDYYAFIELHIEQGCYLLHEDLPMAVVTDIAGIKQFYITLHGVSAHAGGMAMEDRHDAMAAAAASAPSLSTVSMAAMCGSVASMRARQAVTASTALSSFFCRA